MEFNLPKGKQIVHLAKIISTVELEVWELCLQIGENPDEISENWTVPDNIQEKYLEKARDLEYQLGRLRALKLRQQSLSG